jgi:hypothetical protein
VTSTPATTNEALLTVAGHDAGVEARADTLSADPLNLYNYSPRSGPPMLTSGGGVAGVAPAGGGTAFAGSSALDG